MHSPRCAPTPLIALSSYSQAALSILSQSRPPSSFDVPFLRAQLDRIESTLSSLLDQRLLLAARLSEAVALTSPVRLLSSELLSAIFIAATLTSSSSDPPALLSTLMLVCKQWRDVCLSTPELWSSITISPNEPDSLERARRSLIRSKVVPLDIVLDFSPRSSFSAQAFQISYASKQNLQSHMALQSQPVTPDSLLKSSLILLRPTIYRWRTFVLLVPYRPQAAAALQSCTSPAPLLESLTIQVTNPMLHASSVDWGAGASTKGLIPFRGITPRLQSCSITSFWCERKYSPNESHTPPSKHSPSSFYSSSSSQPQSLPYTPRMIFPGVNPFLRKLLLIGFWNDFAPDGAEMMQLLRQCPLLEELHIRNMSDIDGDGSDVHPASSFTSISSSTISLKYLRKLTFYYSGVVRACVILRHTHLPSLVHVELSFLDNITSCLKLLRDQAPPLQSLRIEASLFNELTLLGLLKKISTMNELELVDLEDVSAHLLKGLSVPIQVNEWILPSLLTLNLEGCTSVEWEDLKTLVESRLPSSSASSAARSTSFSAFYTQSCNRSSASQFAKTLSQTSYNGHSRSYHLPIVPPSLSFPRKIARLDLTRCPQISRERIQWLRMYVGEVVCREEKA